MPITGTTYVQANYAAQNAFSSMRYLHIARTRKHACYRRPTWIRAATNMECNTQVQHEHSDMLTLISKVGVLNDAEGAQTSFRAHSYLHDMSATATLQLTQASC